MFVWTFLCLDLVAASVLSSQCTSWSKQFRASHFHAISPVSEQHSMCWTNPSTCCVVCDIYIYIHIHTHTHDLLWYITNNTACTGLIPWEEEALNYSNQYLIIYIMYILHILYSGQTASRPVHPSKVGVKDLHENLKVKAPTSMGGTTLMKVL